MEESKKILENFFPLANLLQNVWIKLGSRYS
ncbi:hypothetical protein SAMN05216352_11840 [Alteribacillus bidgolensis]|uniref:Uncharacterized protein n=1 Tax=Alteribacillus bidgolensis TaxID=930129 RepID=A0A1G8Q8P7_9BACI|nr:hypothetical protein SAMN05216352_11840 [Alteribacillus bidgolensis]